MFSIINPNRIKRNVLYPTIIDIGFHAATQTFNFQLFKVFFDKVDNDLDLAFSSAYTSNGTILSTVTKKSTSRRPEIMPSFQLGLFITERPMAFNTRMPMMANAINTVAMINHIMHNYILGSIIEPQ